MKKAHWYSMCVAASLALAAVILSGATQVETWSPEAVSGRTDWFAVLLRGEQVGYLRVAYRREADAYVLDNRMELRGKAQGTEFHQVQEERFRFALTPPYGVRSGRMSQRQDDALASVQEFDNEADALQFRAGGKARPERLPRSSLTFSDILAPMAWVAAGNATLPLRSRFWDWEQRADGTESYRLLNRGPEAVDLEQTSTGTQLKAHMRFALDGAPLSLELGSALTLRRTDEAGALAYKASTDLYFGGGVPVDKTLGSARLVQRLVLAVSLPSGSTIPSAAGQESHAGQVVLRRPVQGEPVSPEARKAALVVDARLGGQSPELMRLAQQAVDGARTPREQVLKLTAFVAEYLEDAPVLQAVTADELRQQRRGDCTEHTQLFTALARRLGIPTREVAGLVYLGDCLRRFGGHAWAEVELDGRWQAVDPTWNEFGVDATHIRFGEGKDGEESLFLMQDGMRFTVLDVGYAD